MRFTNSLHSVGCSFGNYRHGQVPLMITRCLLLYASTNSYHFID